MLEQVQKERGLDKVKGVNKETFTIAFKSQIKYIISRYYLYKVRESKKVF